MQATDTVDVVWWPSRILPQERRAEVVEKLTASLRQQLIPILEPEQRIRWRQLERQALGTRMLLTGDVADEMRLSNTVRESLSEIALETDKKSAELQKQLMSGGDREALGKQLESLKQSERTRMVKLLTLEQQRVIPELFGQPFDFSNVKRTNPRGTRVDCREWRLDSRRAA